MGICQGVSLAACAGHQPHAVVVAARDVAREKRLALRVAEPDGVEQRREHVSQRGVFGRPEARRDSVPGVSRSPRARTRARSRVACSDSDARSGGGDAVVRSLGSIGSSVGRSWLSDAVASRAVARLSLAASVAPIRHRASAVSSVLPACSPRTSVRRASLRRGDIDAILIGLPGHRDWCGDADRRAQSRDGFKHRRFGRRAFHRGDVAQSRQERGVEPAARCARP